MPWRNSRDQKRNGLCLPTMYNYEMLSTMTRKDVMRKYRKGRILYLRGLEMAFLGKGEETTEQNKSAFRNE